MNQDVGNLKDLGDSIPKEKSSRRPWVTPAIDRIELTSALGISGGPRPADAGSCPP